MRLLNILQWATLTNWSVHFALENSFSYNPNYLLRPIGSFLLRSRNEIQIQDNELYQRLTVRWYSQGVVLRDTATGKDIGTKRQFQVQAGQFLLSRIDARHGAMGMVPSEFAGAIITSDFPAYDLDLEIVNPRFFVLVTSTAAFRRFCQNCSTGTTNRQRLDEKLFLNVAVPIPSLAEQARLVAEYDQQAQSAEQKRKKAEGFHDKSDKHLFSRLGITKTEKPLRRGTWQFIGSGELSRWDPQFLFGSLKLAFSSPPVKLRQLITRFMSDADGKAIRIDPQSEPNSSFHYLGLENIEKNSGELVALPTVKGEELKSSCLRIPKGYVAYNKLRPYLNKFWHNDTEYNDVISSPELFVFELAEEISLPYFLAVLSSSVIQYQIRDIMSGARMPRISEADFINLNFPLPDVKTQRDIAEFFATAKMQAENLRTEATALETAARRTFETQIFA